MGDGKRGGGGDLDWVVRRKKGFMRSLFRKEGGGVECGSYVVLWYCGVG